MSTSSQHAAVAFHVCWVRLGDLLYLSWRALRSRIIWNTHGCSDHISANRVEGEEEKGREKTLEEDILPVMSAPPLGGISLTFTVCWTAAPLFSVFPFFPQSIPSLLPITQSAFHLLSVHFGRFCAACAVVAVWSRPCCTQHQQSFILLQYSGENRMSHANQDRA